MYITKNRSVDQLSAILIFKYTKSSKNLFGQSYGEQFTIWVIPKSFNRVLLAAIYSSSYINLDIKIKYFNYFQQIFHLLFMHNLYIFLRILKSD